MDKNTVLFVIIAALAGFIGGFLLANSINRSELTALRAQAERSMAAPTPPGGTSGNAIRLSNEEIRAKIAEADKNAENFSFQKDLGLALYRYATGAEDPALFGEAARILDRANRLDPKDVEVLTGLGHAWFDLGFARKDLASFEKAREAYKRALVLEPRDPDLQTDLGISYFVQEPPDYDRAATELAKVDQISPGHTRSMQFLVRVYLGQQKRAEAERMLEKLKSADPQNQAIPELTSLLTTGGTGTVR